MTPRQTNCRWSQGRRGVGHPATATCPNTPERRRLRPRALRARVQRLAAVATEGRASGAVSIELLRVEASPKSAALGRGLADGRLVRGAAPRPLACGRGGGDAELLAPRQRAARRGTVGGMAAAGAPGAERVRAAEVVGALCLATDLGMGLPLEHGLQSTLFAARLGERLGADADTLRQAYYACLLFHSACTTDAHVAAQLFGGNLSEHQAPVVFGSPREAFGGVVRALPSPSSPRPVRALQLVQRLPKAARAFKPHMTAMCEVAEMLARGLGMPDALAGLFAHLTDRWDGKGPLGRASR